MLKQKITRKIKEAYFLLLFWLNNSNGFLRLTVSAGDILQIGGKRIGREIRPAVTVFAYCTAITNQPDILLSLQRALRSVYAFVTSYETYCQFRSSNLILDFSVPTLKMIWQSVFL